MTKVLKEVKDTLKLDFVKSAKEVKDTIKLHLVKSLKEVKDKYADGDLENMAQRMSYPFGIVGILTVSSNASDKLLVVNKEQRDHLKALRRALDPSYAVEEEKQSEEKVKNRGLPSLQWLDEKYVAFRKLANAGKDEIVAFRELVNALKDEPNISARDYVKHVYGTF